MWKSFFQIGLLPNNQLTGEYDLKLVLLSYLVASAASYIALDMTSRLRDIDNTAFSTLLWWIGGSIAMGAGIWSMHFIGMLAFKMSMPMSYSANLTALSLVVAILASFFAMFLLKNRSITITRLVIGGVILGLAISTMHYIGMAAMTVSMNIHYLPSLFFLSVLIGIVASEAAIWLALKSNEGSLKTRIRLKVSSAFIMGAAICGMHYTGMAAAVFTPLNVDNHPIPSLDPQLISINVAIVTFFILGLAFFASTYKEILNYHAVKMARETGMAEVASNVLHNVGNALNSVNISANLVYEHNKNSSLASLIEISGVLKQYKGNFPAFLSTDPRAASLPVYLMNLAEYWKKEQSFIQDEMQRLIDKIEHIKNIVVMQQNFCISSSTMNEVGSLEQILEEALILTSIDFTKHHITINTHFKKLNNFFVDKVKLTQILVNLLVNAKDSLWESSISPKLLRLTIELSSDKEKAIIKVTDNGLGITKENLTKIFLYGFTTKKTGHGFGLHGSALAAQEMGGELKANSEGLGKGATFILTIPYKQTKT